MALQTSGSISLLQIQTELGGSSPASLTEYYRNGSYTADIVANGSVPESGAISVTNFYGAQEPPVVTNRDIAGGPGSTSTITFFGGNTAYHATVNTSYYSMPGTPTLYVVTNGVDENDIIQIAFGGMAAGDLDTLQTTLNGDDFVGFWVGKDGSVQFHAPSPARGGWNRLDGTAVGSVLYYNPPTQLNGAAGWLQGFDFTLRFTP